MNSDPQILSQAEAFVNALRNGRRATMRPMPFRQWPQFMQAVHTMMEAKA
ncbi:hypothetical protein Pat9b_4055 (plasmid) [Pantoea sp. At-9b]|nr:hypothetical protein Pat9b_4055 [Pantoea sp. At-9b]